MGKKILIIDDEKDFCKLLQFYLSKRNCDVTITHTLLDGLKQILITTPDVIILDNNLPDGFGWYSAEDIIEKIPEVHIFLVSANKPKDFTIKENNHFHVMEKPISIDQINNFINC